MNKIILLFLFFNVSYMFSPNSIPYPLTQNLNKFNRVDKKFDLNWLNTTQIILCGFGLLSLSWLISSYLCYQVKYAMFNTNLTLLKKKKSNLNFPRLWVYFQVLLLVGLLLSEYPEEFSIQFLLYCCPNVSLSLTLDPKVYKLLRCCCFHVSCGFIFTDAVSPATVIVSVFVFQIWCHRLSSNVPHWVPLILILLANDIELNPGPLLQNQLLSFMN